MEQALPIIFSVVLIILAIIVSVVGIQLVMVLMEVRRTLKRVNEAIETAEAKFNAVVTPLQSLGGMASGLGAGMKVFEAFVGWLNRDDRK
ncbi:MAG TPA: hypothetical protein VF209_04470 [Patescibacteria group bacterium]